MHQSERAPFPLELLADRVFENDSAGKKIQAAVQ